MSDVLIHRCTLRVVRRGGWSWGPDPKRFLDQVMRTFPALLAKKLGAFLGDEVDREIAAPIRIRIPVRLGDFMPEVSGTSLPRSGRGETVSLDARIESALYSAFGREQPRSEQIQPRERFPTSPVIPQLPGPGGLVGVRGALWRLLSKWLSEETLESRLSEFSAPELETWHEALRRYSPQEDGNLPQNEQPTVERVDDFIRKLSPPLNLPSRTDWLRKRIVIAIQLAVELRIAIGDKLLWQTLDQALPVKELPSAAPVLVTESASDVSFSPAGTPSLALKSPPKTTASRDASQPRASANLCSTWEVEVDCALPFLLLGPLSRLGYLDLAAAVLEAAGLEDNGCLFAACLAYKVLSPPNRGWLRDAASCTAAAAFAGLNAPVPEEDLVDFSHKIALHIGPPCALLADTVIRGHSQNTPVALCRADTETSAGFLLVDAEGCFPIARESDLESFLPMLRKLDSVVLVSRDAAGPHLLKNLRNAGLTFVTEVPPTRTEPWRRVQQGSMSLGWTNHAQPESEFVLRAARAMGLTSEEAITLWEAFGIARPAAVRARLDQLDHALTIAAAVSAGVIAWKLWHARGRVTPQLALQRFGDLGARIRFDSTSVLVRLPLGRRHQELSENGLLTPVRHIPWLGGRDVEFGGA